MNSVNSFFVELYETIQKQEYAIKNIINQKFKEIRDTVESKKKLPNNLLEKITNWKNE